MNSDLNVILLESTCNNNSDDKMSKKSQIVAVNKPNYAFKINISSSCLIFFFPNIN
jgi:hypothetical protein